MRRRLRKKKRLGDFIELGFVLRAELVPTLDDPGFDAFLDRWIDAVEARGLVFGGGEDATPSSRRAHFAPSSSLWNHLSRCGIIVFFRGGPPSGTTSAIAMARSCGKTAASSAVATTSLLDRTAATTTE